MELNFRKGVSADRDELTQLSLAAYGQFAGVLGDEHWAVMKSNMTDEGMWAQLFSKAEIFVAMDAERIVGMACLVPRGNPTKMFDAEWCYIRLVGVLPEYEGKGLGRALTRKCIDHAIQAGERIIALHTSEFQVAARHIYESMGFVVLKEIGPAYGKRYWIYTMDIT